MTNEGVSNIKVAKEALKTGAAASAAVSAATGLIAGSIGWGVYKLFGGKK